MRRAALALVLGLAPSPANAAALIELAPQNGVQVDAIWDISGDGKVLVGTCSGAASPMSTPCRWSASAGYEMLAVPPGGYGTAFAASHDGSVVAGEVTLATGEVAPVRWRADGSIQELGSASAGGVAWAISADGSVVVGTHWGPDRPFRWTESTGMVLAPEGTEASAVSSDGSIVAACCIAERWPHRPKVPFLWHADGRLQPLPMLHWTGDRAWGLSGDGRVVLLAPRYDVTGFAWRWSVKEWARPLVKPRGIEDPTPHDASSDGSSIVGTTDLDYWGPSFLWREGAGHRPLREALSDAGVDVSGWLEFYDSRAISDDGCRIPALGSRSNGEWIAVLIVLCGDDVGSGPSSARVPAHGAAVLVAIGLLAAAGGRSKRALALAACLFVPSVARGAAVEAIEPVGGIRLTAIADLSGDAAVVAGRCSSSSSSHQPCRWRIGAGAEWLDVPAGRSASPTAISYDGSVVVGNRSESGWSRAVVWNADGEIEDLPAVDGLLSSEAVGVTSDGGTVIGRLYVLVTPTRAEWRPFRWRREIGYELLAFEGHPSAVSGDGETLLVSDLDRPSLWRSGEEPIPIHAPGGGHFYATALSPDGGTVAGTDDTGPASALRWTPAEGPSLLEPVAYPFILWPILSDVSAGGSVAVGTDEVAGAIVWSAGPGLRRLWDLLVTEAGADATRWDFFDLSRVSDDGRIAVGWGYEDGVAKHFVANLAPACDDGLDNDADGLADLGDPQCADPSGLTEHAPPRCGLGFEVALLLPLLAARRGGGCGRRPA